MIDEVRQELVRLIKDNVAVQLRVGTVASVDQSQRTCDVDPLDGGATYTGVKLRAVKDSSAGSIVLFPAQGSVVVIGVAELDDAQSYLLMAERVDKIEINGDDFGGLVKADVLEDKIDQIKAVLDAIQQAFTTWVVVPGDGGAALKTLASGFISLPVPDSENLQNEKVTHGSV